MANDCFICNQVLNCNATIADKNQFMTAAIQLLCDLPTTSGGGGGFAYNDIPVCDNGTPKYMRMCATACGTNTTVSWFDIQGVATTAPGNFALVTVGPCVSSSNLVLKSVEGRATASGDNTLIAAVAGKKLTVFAHYFSTDSTTKVLCRVTDGAAGTGKWRNTFQAPTATVVGANLATTPPQFLFQGTANTALILNLSSAQPVDWALSYWEA